MSMKFTTSILKIYFKSLLEVRQPIVTRRITECLHALCLFPTSEVFPEALLDLLCPLASSISTNEKSVDCMTFTARLLDVGMRKVYGLNRKLCVVELPLVFNALGEILACDHKEAWFAAMEAFKSLIVACIDERLIKQGVDQIMVNAEIDVRRSQPTIIEKICATVESLLGYKYIAVWDMVFQVVSTMFDKLGISFVSKSFGVYFISFLGFFSSWMYNKQVFFDLQAKHCDMLKQLHLMLFFCIHEC
ncbi:uncharacterized protein LOC122092706 [Macadamia integrifolia]|uniref:uncharacterized protein LOC122092706 n=1 Tax=Macadamia integrifolia TaxID=60698 RepID=UPI001C52E64F|nr:uncharacterized protein LOC122092706 [Macadamia integrifolia]